jgi:drug/metabolite transporter superfamily protein YnfA
MTRTASLAILLLAAILEAGGDALVRSGLRAVGPTSRALLFLAGAVVLFAYGYLVNTPPWDFGRLLGIYVVLFFLVAQLISWAVFNQPPGRGVLIGGVFVVVGGLIMAARP